MKCRRSLEASGSGQMAKVSFTRVGEEDHNEYPPRLQGIESCVSVLDR